jgi:hypothetical protein
MSDFYQYKKKTRETNELVGQQSAAQIKVDMRMPTEMKQALIEIAALNKMNFSQFCKAVFSDVIEQRQNIIKQSEIDDL